MNKNIFVFLKQFYLKVITNIFSMITDLVLLVFNITKIARFIWSIPI